MSTSKAFHFNGFFQWPTSQRNPDPSNEQRGISGFTYAVAGETLLRPSIWSQAKGMKLPIKLKAEAFKDLLDLNATIWISEKYPRGFSGFWHIQFPRDRNSSFQKWKIDGETVPGLDQKMKGALCPLRQPSSIERPNTKGLILEGRNQITSDGEPRSKFTVNPFVFTISTPWWSKLILSRFDPLDFDKPDDQLYKYFQNTKVDRRLPTKIRTFRRWISTKSVLTSDDLKYRSRKAEWIGSKEKLSKLEANK